MSDTDTLITVLEAAEQRREQRRRFLKFAGTSTIAVGGLALLNACGDDDNDSPAPTPSPSPSPTPTPTTSSVDLDVLNFALNLEYLEAQFYSFAAFGTGLSADIVGSSPGAVTGGRKVNFTDPLVAAYAREIAADEIAHVKFLRTAIGSTAVAQPALNIDGSSTGAFTAAARAAQVIGASEVFDPYASDEAFLLGAYIFEDVGVTAYKGGAPLLTSKVYLEAAAGILAAEAYHAGLIRTVLYAKGIDATNLLRVNANKISDARDSLDGTMGNNANLDEGITNTDGSANLVPTDGNGIAFSRTTGQVLNIVYLNKAATTSGGFFPSGLNGNIKTSAANP